MSAEQLSNKDVICYLLTRFKISSLTVVVICSLWNLQNTCQALSYNNNYYRGAVVEYAPSTRYRSEKPENVILRNANRYEKIVTEAQKENVDIIVFPECGLTAADLPVQRNILKDFCTFVPQVVDQSIPCTEKNEKVATHLRILSCAARTNNIYVVVNLHEKEECNKTRNGCPSDGFLFYNTNIVFDRKGKLIAKYRKINLFYEPEVNVTAEADLVTFDTDFGVRFGMFICFDILFYEPAIKVVEKEQVKNIVYSTLWYSQLPFLAGVGVQSAYSYSQNINLLASGYSRPKLTNGGSGIYAGELGPLVSITPEQATTKLLISNLPKDNSNLTNNIFEQNPYSKIIDINFKENFEEKDQDMNKPQIYLQSNISSTENIFNFYNQNLTGYSTQILDANEFGTNHHNGNQVAVNGTVKRFITFSYKNNDFDCKIAVVWKKDNNFSNLHGPVYRLAGFSGNRTYNDLLTVYTEVCALLTCQDENFITCGHRPNFNTSNLTDIVSVSINIKSPIKSNPYVVTYDKNLLSLPGEDISFTSNIYETTKVYTSSLLLRKPHNDLITFGIYKT